MDSRVGALGYILGSQHDKVTDWLDPVPNVIIGIMVCYYLYRVLWAYERKPE